MIADLFRSPVLLLKGKASIVIPANGHDQQVTMNDESQLSHPDVIPGIVFAESRKSRCVTACRCTTSDLHMTTQTLRPTTGCSFRRLTPALVSPDLGHITA
jgi:hypothetical protein